MSTQTTSKPNVVTTKLRDLYECLRVMKEWLKYHPDPTDAEYVFNKLIPKYERAFNQYNEREQYHRGRVQDAENLNCAKDPVTGIRLFESYDITNRFGQNETIRQLAYTPEGAVKRDAEIRMINAEWQKEREQFLEQTAEVPVHYFDITPFNFSKTQLSALNGFVHVWAEE